MEGAASAASAAHPAAGAAGAAGAAAGAAAATTGAAGADGASAEGALERPQSSTSQEDAATETIKQDVGAAAASNTPTHNQDPEEAEETDALLPTVTGSLSVLGADRKVRARADAADVSALTESTLLDELAACKAALELSAEVQLPEGEDAEMAEKRVRQAAVRLAQLLDELRIPASELISMEDRVARRAALLKERAFERATRQLSTSSVGRASTRAVSKVSPGAVAALLELGVSEHFRALNRLLYNDDQHLKVDVTFKDVHFEVREGESNLPEFLRGPETVGNSTTRMLFGPFIRVLGWMRGCASGSNAKVTNSKDVLANVSGVLRGGDMTLVLGPAGAGKTSLMYALSKRLHSGKTQTFEGDVRFAGYKSSELHIPNIATYVSQLDVHIATLTVQETLEFARSCRARADQVQKMQEIRGEAVLNEAEVKEYWDSRTRVVLALLGLTRAANTVIGNEVLKGVSGGEKRRVTLGELLVVGSKVLLLDEISTGLDSAATFDITKTLRSMCTVFSSTVVVSLLQPPPETFDLFDKVLLMCQGHIIYHGPRADVIDYFTALGYPCPSYQDPADFLQEVSTPGKAAALLAPGFSADTAPTTPEQLAAAFQESKYYAEMAGLIDAVHGASSPEEAPTAPESDSHKRQIEALVTSPMYRKSFWDLVGVVFSRQWMVLRRNKTFLIARIVQNLIMGLLLGLFCFQLPFEQYYIKVGVLYFMLMFVGLGSGPLLNDILLSRNVFYKQRREAFYSPLNFVLGDFTCAMPIVCMDALVLGSIIYFMVGLSLDGGGRHYFIFLLFLIVFGAVVSAMIRMLAYSLRDRDSVFGLFIGIVMFMVIFSGAVATRETLPNYYIWLFWVNPLTWAYTSLVMNEFYSETYTGPPATVNGECVRYCGEDQCPEPYPQMNCGQYFLEARQFVTNEAFMWGGIGFLFMWMFIFLALSVLALTCISYDEKVGALGDDVVRGEVHFHPTEKKKKQQQQQQHGDEEDAGEPLTQEGIDLEMQQIGERPGPSKADTNVDVAAASGGDSAPLTFEPLTLSFRNLRYSVEIPRRETSQDKKQAGTRVGGGGQKESNTETLEILRGIDGYAKPKTMTALMGSSGAGKTTLMDCLADRKTVGTLSGEVFTNGRPKNAHAFSKVIGYVEQFGVHLAKATVRESIEFSGALRLPEADNVSILRKQTQDVLEMLELEPIANRLIGNSDTGLSFEEVKRITIAVELVANPSIIFADEPTSGLEARAASLVISCLRRIADTGRTVVCTVHQPNEYIFHTFDRLLLLKRGGEVVFFDDLGEKSSNLVKYFASVPGVDPCPDRLNPATWMLTVIGAGVGGAETRDFALYYRQSEMYSRNLDELDQLMPVDWDEHLGEEGEDEDVEDMFASAGNIDLEREQDEVPALYSRPFSVQLILLLRRNFVEYWRTPSYSFSRWVIMVGLSIIIGLIFVNSSMNNAADIQSRISCINMVATLAANYNVVTIIPFLFTHKALFYRERSSSMYSPIAYGVAMNLVEDPFIFIEVTLTAIVFYWLCGFVASPVWVFFYFWFLLWCFVMAMTFLAMFYASIMPTAASAQVLGTLTTQVFGLASGVLILPSSIPGYLIWIYYISPQRWCQEGLISTQFQFETGAVCIPSGTPYFTTNGTCPEGQVLYEDIDDLDPFCCPAGNFGTTPKDYVLGPLFLGGTNGYRFDWRWWDVLYLLGLMLIGRVCTLIATAKVNHNKR